jgi:hypothetical protein
MLLPYTTLTYFGPAAAAMVVGDSIGSVEMFAPRGSVRSGLNVQITSPAPYIRPIRLIGFPMVSQGLGTVQAMQPRGRLRVGLSVKIGTLTQDDVTGAVFESKVEGDLTLKQAIRILLAHAAGSATGLESASPAFLSQDGNTTRIAGTYSAGTRTVTTVDGS